MAVSLSVNINKIATLRNARGGDIPSVTEAAIRIQEFGADGITVHPRPDQRHITYADVKALHPLITTEFNIEGYPNNLFIQLVLGSKPDQVTLVPDPPGVLTSNAGWNTIKYQKELRSWVEKFKQSGIRTSLFIETEEDMIRAAADTGTDRIELYTESYASLYPSNPKGAVAPFIQSARLAADLGLGVNAGHDLNLDNLSFFKNNIPELLEVSIGHALISNALYLGLENTVSLYKRALTT